MSAAPALVRFRAGQALAASSDEVMTLVAVELETQQGQSLTFVCFPDEARLIALALLDSAHHAAAGEVPACNHRDSDLLDLLGLVDAHRLGPILLAGLAAT